MNKLRSSEASRFNQMVNNLTNISTNLATIKSARKDTKFAKETTELAKSLIMQQTLTTMLSRANASKQTFCVCCKAKYHFEYKTDYLQWQAGVLRDSFVSISQYAT